MKILAILFCVIVFSFSVFAQDAPKKTRAIWSKDCDICDRVVVEGVEYRIFKDTNVEIALNFGIGDDHWMGDVYIYNKGERFDFDPKEDAAMLVWQTVKDYESKVTPQVIFPLDPVKIANKTRKGARWGNVFRAFAAGMARQRADVNTTYRGQNGGYLGSSQSTVTVQDRAAQNAAAVRNAEANADAADRADSIISLSLKENTIFTDKSIFGTIYYPKMKKHEVASINFIIAGKIYDFRYRNEKK